MSKHYFENKIGSDITQNWSSLNQYYYFEYYKREQERIDKEKKEKDEFRKYLKERGYQQIDKEFAKTLVCDRAILECDNAYFERIELTETLYDFSPTNKMIKFVIPKPRVLLMGIDPVGTSEHKKAENFEPDAKLYCKTTGAPCEIKKKAILWNDVIQHTKINGYPILVKESKLLCSNCPSAKITFKDNGQDKEIRYADFAKTMSSYGWNPTTKKIAKSVIPASSFIGGAGLSIGGLYITYMSKGVFAPIGNSIAASGAIQVVDSSRDLYQIWSKNNTDMYQELSKGILSFIGFKKEQSEKLSENIINKIDIFRFWKGTYKNVDKLSKTYLKNTELIEEADQLAKNLNSKNKNIKNLETLKEKSQLKKKDANRLRKLKRDAEKIQKNIGTLVEQDKYTEVVDLGKDTVSKVFDNMNLTEKIYKLQLEYSDKNFWIEVSGGN